MCQAARRVARKFKSVNLTDLPIVPSALYLLAANSIPEEARTEAIERAAKGESINYQTAKQIKSKHTKSESFHDNQEEQPSTSPSPSSEPSVTQDHQPSFWQTIDLVQLLITASKDIDVHLNLPSEIESESWWRLGEEHLLYCGDPKSAIFQESFPQKIDLSLVFPHQSN